MGASKASTVKTREETMKVINAILIGLMAIGVTQAHASEGHASPLGQPGNPAKVTRTVDIVMSDAMRYTPGNIKVKRGETIRFRVKNAGQIKHEMVLGSLAELKEHAKTMAKFPEMEHDDPNAISVESGKTGELVWRFTQAGKFDFACLVPGHFEAGMQGKIAVRG
jgi:uncharacterized cupredoxin-like copper-binding protein